MATPLTLTSFSGEQASAGYARYSSTAALGIPPGEVKTAKIAAFTRATFFSEELFGGKQLVVVGPANVPDLSVGLGRGAASIIVLRVEPTTNTVRACCFGQLAPSACGEFTPGSNTCAGALAKYCANPASLGDQNCRTWCANNPTVCDSAVMQYCGMHPNDVFCGCITSQAAVRGIVNPKCVDRKCLNGGYLTAAMQSGQCPSIISCDIKLTLDNSGVEIGSSIPIQQNCGGESTITTEYTELDADAVAAQAALQKQVMLFIVALVIILGGIGVFVFMGDDKPTQWTAQQYPQQYPQQYGVQQYAPAQFVQRY